MIDLYTAIGPWAYLIFFFGGMLTMAIINPGGKDIQALLNKEKKDNKKNKELAEKRAEIIDKLAEETYELRKTNRKVS